MYRNLSFLVDDERCSSHGSNPRLRRSVRRQRRRLVRRHEKRHLREMAEIAQELLDQDSRREKIQDYLNSGARPGCCCGCGGEYLQHLIDSLEYNSWEAYVVALRKQMQEAMLDEAWEYWETRISQIKATQIALSITFQEAEAFWENTAASP